MSNLAIGCDFPAAELADVNGGAVQFPGAFSQSPATIVFFYRGRW